jgi:hypothetical protein
LSERVPEEDTWFRTRFQFMMGVGTKPRITKTTKNFKFGVIGRGSKDFLVRR